MAVVAADFFARLCEGWGFNQPFMRNVVAHMNLSDEEMRDIPNPWNEMQLHVSFKCAEAFCLLGLGAGAVFFRRSPKVVRRAGQVAFASSCLGAGPIGFAMWNGKASTLKQEDIYDRAYRCRYSKNQIRIDNVFEGCTYLGMVGGLLSTRSLSGVASDAGLVSAAGLLGVIAWTVYNNPDKLKWPEE
mmetsp:Transcript_31315/g.58810  ORF Transcript_31315/g.58810 Transcript_31315/m.58810 type:complete len:187 (-) Transcript_31315:73-633(-)